MDIEKVKIVADSSGDLMKPNSISFASAALKISTTEKEYIDNEDLDVGQMVEYLQSYKGRSFTSCPNVSDWITSFGDAQYVFCVTITSSLSGSYNSAVLAKKEYEEEHPDRKVYIVNSLSTGPEMYLIIEKLEELIVAGNDFEEVSKEIEKYCENTGLLFMLQSMRNLANNGRVSHIAAKMAGILGIRALGRASDKGELEMLEKCRGEKRSLDAIVETLKKLGYKGGKIRLAHCFNEEFAEKLKNMLTDAYKEVDLKLYACGGLCSFYAEKGGILIGFEKA